ncbi:hypothetical protein [Virgisporangium ochraceum]|uniref:Uncharacterized protein n=1 Tax=Virgisporangium ochraceum TaxID=65505 RepID=A0A8J4EEA0_9ACTN|nr:hypothetical protein [Virgisporangium ochraceum]GIJ71529.1 hypothetical protein Voc01_064460 [Virgisporangium ochraceum]
MHTRRPAAVISYHVRGRSPGTGRILAVFTDSHTDLAVARHAADLAARAAVPIVAAAAVRQTRFSLNPLLHRVRARRIAEESAAITARVEPILRRANTRVLVTSLALSSTHRSDQPPAVAVYRLALRVGATVVVAGPLEPPVHGLHPINARNGDHPHTPTPPPAATTG